MTGVRLFTHAATGDDIRVVTEADGSSWFVAADLARILDYRDAHNLARRLDEDEKGTRLVSTPHGEQHMTVVSEAGLYAAILGSQVRGARTFKRWVTHELLPTLRRTGTYSTPAEMPSHSEALRGWASEIEARERAEAQVAELEPSARAWDHLADDAVGDYSVREAAQILDRDPAIKTGQNRLFKTLREIGWTDRTNRPYQHHVNVGRLAVKMRPYDHPYTGEQMLDSQVRITAKGLSDLHKALGGARPLAVQPKLQLVAGE